MLVNISSVLLIIACIVFAPDDWTVTTPELKFLITYCVPSARPVTAGIVTVWVVLPVNTCCPALAIVNAVVDAAVTVVANPFNKLFAERFKLASHPAHALAAGVVATLVFAVPPFAIGKAVPLKATANVPEVVIGDPPIDKNAGTLIATDVTDPPALLEYFELQADAVVNEVDITVRSNIVPDAIACIVLAPDDCTVTVPELLFTMLNFCPKTIVLVTGITTVWVVEPVKYCCSELATVKVVVTAAVAIVEYPFMWLFADKLLLLSHDANELGDGVG